MSSFSLQRNLNNSLIKKTVNFSATPSVNNNSQSLGSTGSVNSASINILTLNGTQVTATGDKLNYVDVSPGTASASKALVLDSSRNISNINSVSCASLTVNGTAITGSSTPTELTGITAGIASASKALVLDATRNIRNINNLSSSYLTITPNTATSVLLTDWTQNITPASSSPWQQITYSPELNLFVSKGTALIVYQFVIWFGSVEPKPILVPAFIWLAPQLVVTPLTKVPLTDTVPAV